MSAKKGAVRVEHIGISVSDMPRAIAFFENVLGGEASKLGTFEGPAVEASTGVREAKIEVAYVDVGAQRFELVRYLQPADSAPIDAGPDHAGHIHISVKTPDFDNMIRRLEEAGFSSPYLLQKSDQKLGGGLYFYGFDNLVIELKAE
jgi:catechol 2,3-dioxygenase-like lactoylglutathione lyase family enzyme